MKTFALVGAAGYIAPRHMRAIYDTGNKLVAAMDISDSVGIIDSYFPESAFFTEFERFDRHLEKLRRDGEGVDYLVVCSPNYLHDAHIRAGLRLGADVICEKPIVLNPWNIEALQELETESQGNVYSILQLRLHQDIISLKKEITSSNPNKRWKCNLEYVTSRGMWYHYSWKANDQKSGGIATNIGIHFFDMLGFLFGEVQEINVDNVTDTSVRGRLTFSRADVEWHLSINHDDLPEVIKSSETRTFRSITIDGDAIEFSGGFTELHTDSYRAILAGEGFRLKDTIQSINIASSIRAHKSAR